MQTPITFRAILIGNSFVGKTSIIKKLINEDFSNEYRETIGGAFYTYTYHYLNQIIILQIWDTAGQEKYQSLGPIYYRNSNIGIFVYDQNNEESFNSLKNWIKLYYSVVSNNNLIYIVGNKSDLEENNNIQKKVDKFCKDNNYLFIKVSALNGFNIERLFQNICLKLIEQYNENLI